MVYCLIQIRKCFVGEDYLQNHHDIIQLQTKEDALNYIKTVPAHKLGDPNLPTGVPDIRHKIINERGEIYGYLDANDEPHYFALVEMEESRRNQFLKEDQ